MKDFITHHFKSIVGLSGSFFYGVTKWIAAQTWIQNTVGLFTIVWLGCLIFGYFKRKAWRGKVDTGE